MINLAIFQIICIETEGKRCSRKPPWIQGSSDKGDSRTEVGDVKKGLVKQGYGKVVSVLIFDRSLLGVNDDALIQNIKSEKGQWVVYRTESKGLHTVLVISLAVF